MEFAVLVILIILTPSILTVAWLLWQAHGEKTPERMHSDRVI